MSAQPTVAQTTTDLYNALGPIPNLGAGDQSAGWPLLRFLDGIGQIIQRSRDLCSDDTAGNPGWSIILDPARCPTYALPWLAQCVGVQFDQTQSTDAAQRAAIKAEQGFTRGTPAAMQAAAQKWMTPNQRVVISERDTDPYHLTVVLQLGHLVKGSYSQTSATYATYSARTAGRSTYSTPSYPQAQVNAALQAQKPAGLIMTVNIIAGPTYSTVSAAFTTYSARQAALPTFADVAVY